ncbi:MAG: hypothetical protein HY318_05115 [Armatimonadetes bacterium]|nr:hypothetical protein [Armatimonadota bacterium]
MSENKSGGLGPVREDFQKSFTHQGVKPQGNPPTTRPTQPPAGSSSQKPTQSTSGSGGGKKP